MTFRFRDRRQAGRLLRAKLAAYYLSTPPAPTLAWRTHMAREWDEYATGRQCYGNRNH